MQGYKSFNLFDTVQAGLQTLSQQAVATIKSHWLLLLLVAVVLGVIGRIIAWDTGMAALQSLGGRNPGVGFYINAILSAVVTSAAIFLLLCYLAVDCYRRAGGFSSSGYAFKLGTSDPPLFGVTQEQALMMRSSLRPLLALWPIVMVAIFSVLIGRINLEILYADMSGRGSSGLVVLRSIMQLIWLFFFLAYLAGIARHYLFRPAVIVETGQADKQEIGAFLPGRFPSNIVRAGYWNCVGLIIIVWLPMWLVNYLVKQLFESMDMMLTDSWIILSISYFISFVAMALGLTFLGGALHHARSSASTAIEVAAESA